MAITISGIKIKNVSVGESSEKPTGTYEVITSNGKVLASQQFNTYGGIEVPFSIETTKALNAYLEALKSDINTLIGM